MRLGLGSQLFSLFSLCGALTGCGEEFRAVGTGGTAGQGASGGAGASGGSAGAASGGTSAGGSAGTDAGGSDAGPVVCRGLQFDGKNDLVHVPDAAAFDGLAVITVEAWIFPDGYPDEVHILSHHDHNLATGYVLLIFPGSEMQFRYQFGGQSNSQGFTPVAAGQWHHVAATYDAGNVKLFVDGQLTDEGTVPVGVADDCVEPLVIGRAAYEDNFAFQGTIDEVRVSRVARYQASFVPAKEPFSPDSDTVGLWHFDELNGQITKDAVGKHPGTRGVDNQIADDDPVRVDVPCLSEMVLGG